MMRRGKSNKPDADSIANTLSARGDDESPTDVYEGEVIIPSGATLFDLVVGGGIPSGMINIVGDSSSGKSFLSGELLAAVYHKYNGEVDWFYDNVEKGYRIDSNELYGFDILGSGYFTQDECSDTIEQFEYKIAKVLKEKDPARPFIYVLDSYDSLTSESEIKYQDKRRKTLDKLMKARAAGDIEAEGAAKGDSGSYGLDKQKFMHAFCRGNVRALVNNNVWLILVSQVKDNIGVMFGPKYKRLGGKALDFYPNIVVWLAEVEKYLIKNRPVGVCVKIRGTKVRNKRPFRACFIDLVFDYGIDDISSNLKFLYDLKTDLGKDKKSDKVKWDGKEYTLRKLIKHIEKNDLEAELRKRVINKWEDIEQSISSKGRKSKWGLDT